MSVEHCVVSGVGICWWIGCVVGKGLAARGDWPGILRSEAGERDRFPLMFGRQTRMALREHEIEN